MRCRLYSNQNDKQYVIYQIRWRRHRNAIRVASCVSIIVAVYSFTVLRNSSDVASVRSTEHEIPKNMLSISHREERDFKTKLKPFLIDTPTCRIRHVHPFDKSIDHIVNNTKPFKCPSVVLLTYDTMDELHINWTTAKLPPYNGAVAFCTYIPVYRPKDKPEHKDFAGYLDESDPFYTFVKVNHDFVQVRCYDKSMQVLY